MEHYLAPDLSYIDIGLMSFNSLCLTNLINYCKFTVLMGGKLSFFLPDGSASSVPTMP